MSLAATVTHRSGDTQNMAAHASNSSGPSTEYRFNFGKYNGQRLSTVPASYISFLIQKNVAAGRLDLKTALEAYVPHASRTSTTQNSSFTPDHGPNFHRRLSPMSAISVETSTSDLLESTAQRISSSSSILVKPEPSSASFPAVPQVYRLHFGRHEGKTLSEVPMDFVLRLKKLIELPGFKQATPELRDALILFHIPEEDLVKEEREKPESKESQPNKSLAPRNIKKEEDYKKPILPPPRPTPKPKILPPAVWTPPYMGTARYNPHFWDSFENNYIWISIRDCIHFFGFTKEHLDQLDNIGSSKKWKKFYLYHVWDLFRYSTSQKRADEALEAFTAKNEDKTEEIWGMMGLGCNCCCPDYDDYMPEGGSDDMDGEDPAWMELSRMLPHRQ